MLRVFRVKLKDYVKEPIAAENLSFPWMINGLKEAPVDGSQSAFIDFRRIISEERLQSMMIGLFLRLNEQSVLKLEKTVEHSLMTKMYREIQRIQHHKYNLRFDLRCFDFQVYNIINNYRVGVHKGRQRNRPLDLREFDTTINQLPFHCIFKKRPLLDDLATLSLMIDVVFKTTGSVKLVDKDNQCILENNPNDEEIHTIRLESDIMSCNYRSAKGQQPNLKDMKNKQDNLHIIDIDGFMNGNYSNSFRQIGNMSTMVDSITDTQRMNNQSIDDSLAYALFVTNAYEHIRVIRDYVGATRLQLKNTRRSIYELKNSISALEHQQIKELTNLEYGMQSSINQLRKQFHQESMEQEGQNSIYQSQLSRLQNDDQELKLGVAQLDAKLKDDCHEMGQYFYNERLSAQLE